MTNQLLASPDGTASRPSDARWPFSPHIRRCQPSEARAVVAWLKERHYLHSAPPGFIHVLEVIEGKDRVGALILGRPGPRELDSDRILELTRAYLIDEAPHNSESHVLALMRRHVRVWLPGIRLLLAYSDPAAGHDGGIYEADGWAPFGKTRHRTGYGWRSRPNRSSDPVSPKLRWVRTP